MLALAKKGGQSSHIVNLKLHWKHVTSYTLNWYVCSQLIQNLVMGMC